MRKILSCIVVMVFLASAVLLAVTPAAAISKVYEEKIAGDTDENGELTKEELVSAILPYILEEGALALDDVGDASYVYAYWNGKPMVVTDQYDRTVTLYRPVERIITIFPSVTRLILTLDGCDRLVGVSSTTIERGLTRLSVKAYPEIMELSGIGSHRNPNSEFIATLRPDVVFSSGFTRGAPIQERTAIPVICLSIGADYKGPIFEAHRLASKVIGKEERAEELISYINEEIAKVTEVTSEIPESEKPRVYCISGCGGKPAITKTWGHYDPITVAGGINVAENYVISTNSRRVTREQIIAWNPDRILIHGIGLKHQISKEDILSDPDFQTLNAVKNRSVNYTRGYAIGWDHTTGLTETFYLAKLFHPDKFEDLNEEKEGNEIIMRLYGVDVDDLYTQLLDQGDRYRWK